MSAKSEDNKEEEVPLKLKPKLLIFSKISRLSKLWLNNLILLYIGAEISVPGW